MAIAESDSMAQGSEMKTMSDDLIGWETLKKINFQKKLDEFLASQEIAESNVQEIKIHLELMEDGFTKKMIIGSLDLIMDFLKLQRIQVIWINALKEGMMEIESRFDKLEQNK